MDTNGSPAQLSGLRVSPARSAVKVMWIRSGEKTPNNPEGTPKGDSKTYHITPSIDLQRNLHGDVRQGGHREELPDQVWVVARPRMPASACRSWPGAKPTTSPSLRPLVPPGHRDQLGVVLGCPAVGQVQGVFQAHAHVVFEPRGVVKDRPGAVVPAVEEDRQAQRFHLSQQLFRCLL